MMSKLLLFWTVSVTIFFGAMVFLMLKLIHLLKIQSRFPDFMVRMWGKTALLWHSIKVIGEENLITGSPQIIYSNHQSNFDILILSSILKIKFSWLAKHTLFEIKLFGLLLKELGYIPVDRDNVRKAAKSILEGIKKLQQNINIIIFPEGTWNSGDTLLPFKPGLHLLARKSKVPLVPIKIIGSDKINPPDTLTISTGKVTVTIFPPIYPEEYLKLTQEEFLTKMRDILSFPHRHREEDRGTASLKAISH